MQVGQRAAIDSHRESHRERGLSFLQLGLRQLTEHCYQFSAPLWICPGRNLGFLRGKLAVAEGYQQLQQSLNEA